MILMYKDKDMRADMMGKEQLFDNPNTTFTLEEWQEDRASKLFSSFKGLYDKPDFMKENEEDPMPREYMDMDFDDIL